MSLNFPSSPVIGQQYSYSGKTWEWSGSYWKGVSIYVPSGASGLSGSVGLSGLIGISGIGGSIGTSGLSGLSGLSGIIGEPGITGGLNLFFNSSVAQSPAPYRQLGKLTTTNPQTGITVNLTSLQKNVLVDSGWITDPGVPGVLVVPNGIWHAYSYFTKNAINDDIEYYFTVSKYTTGGTKTLIFSSSTVQIGWENDNTTPVETKTNGVATTAVLDLTDRIIVDLYVNNNQSGNKTVTFYTEGTQNYSYIVTTLEVVGQSGISGLSGLSGQSGLQGISGLSGLQGVSGLSGLSGANANPLYEVTITGTQDSSNKTFTLASPIPGGNLHMFFNNGQLLTYGSDYTITGTTLEFATLYPAPTPTDVLRANMFITN